MLELDAALASTTAAIATTLVDAALLSTTYPSGYNDYYDNTAANNFSANASSARDMWPTATAAAANVMTTSVYDWCQHSLFNGSCHNATFNSSNQLNSSYAGADFGYADLGFSSTTVVPSSDEHSFQLPWWRHIMWNILFGAMVLVSTGGNLIVVWIVMSTKRMRTVTNYFIVNLSIADAMVSSLNVTFNYIYMLDNDWSFGELYCKISQFISVLSVSASVFTLMAISIDRYVAIMKPLQPRMSKRNNIAIAAAIWVVSIIIASPMLAVFTTDVADDSTRTVCYSHWPDGLTNHSRLESIYNILLLILTYFLPIISMTVTYSRVGIELWGSKAIGEYTPRQVENIKSKRRVVKMMIVVVLIFGVCWLPYHTYFILTSCYPDITETSFIQELYLVIYWLAMSNSMYNPIIYCWMNSRFRFGFKMFFRWCPFVHVGAETLNRRDNMTSRYSCSGSPDHNRIKRNDTQRSFLYTCPGSPGSRRISSCGILRNTTKSCTMTTQRDYNRHSAPIGCQHHHHQQHQQQQQQLHGNSVALSGHHNYHQRSSLHNNHEMTTMGNYCSSNSSAKSKDFIKLASRSPSGQQAAGRSKQPLNASFCEKGILKSSPSGLANSS